MNNGKVVRSFAVLVLIGTATALVAATQGSAQSTFDWKQAAGATINVQLNQHPYQAALVEKLDEFTKATGITVKFTVTPEENYFDKVTTALFAKNGNPDVFMTGIYQSWDYATAGSMEPLDAYMNDPKLTSPDYNAKDFFPGVLNAGKWSLKVGTKSGTGPQWVLPLGFESNTIMYNKKYFDSKGLKPPATLDQAIALSKKLKDWNGPGSYGIAVRGTRSWATIHPGYMSAFDAAGGKDFVIKDNKLVSGLDSKIAIDFTKKWAQMVRDGGPPSWSTYTWYQSGTDLGAGKAAMLFDADIIGYFQNLPGASKEAGNIGWAQPLTVRAGQKPSANEWIWGVGMNKSSTNKTAAWLFMQYFTSPQYQTWAAVNKGTVNPPRASTWADADFKKKLESVPTFVEAFNKYIGATSIKFTPQPYFFETTTDWAAALQKIVIDNADPEATMKELAAGINEKTSKIKLGN